MDPVQRRTRVYVAGPISKGDQFVNVRNAIKVSKVLFDAGYAPYCPHLTGLWQMVEPMAWEDWLTLDEEWLVLCDAVLRLPGESKGSDREVRLANDKKIDVFYSMTELLSSLSPVRLR